MLEWFQSSRRTAVTAVVFTFGLMVVVALLKAGGFGWVTVWWMWLIIGSGLLLVYVVMLRDRHSAGADWLKGREGWVRTYELTKVTAHRVPSAIQLRLTDSGGRRLDKTTAVLQSNPLLWDLVYNGILHSVHVNGAETNSLARKYLKLDHVGPAAD